jgi:hypothetical protein
LEAGEGLAVEFGVGIDEIVEGIAVLLGRKAEVAAVGEEDAVDVVGAEEIVALGGIFPRFGGVNGNPAKAIEVELCPAVIAGDVAFGLRFGERETNFKARGNPGSAHHADEERVEIGAIAALGSAGPDGVAAAPAFAGLVVAHGGDDVIVDVACLGECGGVTGGLLTRKIGDDACEGDELVGLKVALEVRRGRIVHGHEFGGRRIERYLMLEAGGDEMEGDVEAGVQLRGSGLKKNVRVAVF